MPSIRGALACSALLLGLAVTAQGAPAALPQVAASGGAQNGGPFDARAAAIAAAAGATACRSPTQVSTQVATANQTIWAVVVCRDASKAGVAAVVRVGATGGIGAILQSTTDPHESLTAGRVAVYAPHGGELICAEHGWDDESPPHSSQTTTCLAWKGGALTRVFGFSQDDRVHGHDYSMLVVAGPPPAILLTDAVDEDFDGEVDDTSTQATVLSPTAFDAPVAVAPPPPAPAAAPPPAPPRAARVEADGSTIGLPAISADGAWVAVETSSSEVGQSNQSVAFLPLGKGELAHHTVNVHSIDTGGDEEGNFAPSIDTPDAGEIATVNARLVAGNFQPVTEVPGISGKKVESKRGTTTLTFKERGKKVGSFQTEDSVNLFHVIRGATGRVALIEVAHSDWEDGSSHNGWELVRLK
jgi:hypothetical protein